MHSPAIVSSDSHIVEHPQAISAYASPSWRNIAPRIIETEKFGDAYVIDGLAKVLPLSEVVSDTVSINLPCFPGSWWSAPHRLRSMSSQGVDGELLFPTVGLMVMQHPDPEYVYEFSWAYNRWLAAEWSGDRRLGRIMMLPSATEAQFVGCVEYAVSEGFVGLLLPSRAPVGAWSDLRYLRLFAMAAEADLLIVGHAFTCPPRPHLSRHCERVFGAEIEAVDFLTELVFGGVMEREPALKVLFAEGDTWWTSNFVDKVYEIGRYVGLLERVRLTADELVGGAVDQLLVWGSDFPHQWSPEAESAILTRALDMTTRHAEYKEFCSGSFWRVGL